jgi:hypothetical protein
MAALITLTAICLFAAGVLTGISVVAAVAIRREDRNPALLSRAPDILTRAGRRLTRLHVRGPSRATTSDAQKALAQPTGSRPWGKRKLAPCQLLPAGPRMEQRAL